MLAGKARPGGSSLWIHRHQKRPSMTWCLECRTQASLDRAAIKRTKTSISAPQYFVREFLKRQACHVPTTTFLDRSRRILLSFSPAATVVLHTALSSRQLFWEQSWASASEVGSPTG